MALKDSKLEKEQLVVKGDILADKFRDRLTGQELAALSPETLEELKELLTNPEIKTGNYIWTDNGNLQWVEEIPEDYDGLYLLIDYNNDEFNIGYNSGYSIAISVDYINIRDEDGNNISTFNSNGVDKLDFANLTHSFAELDETLQTIMSEAFTDAGNNGVSCSEAQWGVIKALLDKSLYLNYSGYSVIKVSTNGLDNYLFGSSASATVFAGVYRLEINYDYNDNLIFATYGEA